MFAATTRRRLLWCLPIVALAAAGAGIWLVPRMFSGPTEEAETNRTPEKSMVELSAGKAKSTSIRTVKVLPRRLQPRRTIPGRIDYDGSRHVQLTAPVESVVLQVLVKPGDVVQQGSRLAILSSSQVGLARAEVENMLADVKVAEQADRWAEDVAQNLEQLLALLRKHPTPNDVEREFDGRLLGDHRSKVLPAYAQYVVAEALCENLESLGSTGALSQKTVRERESARNVTRAEFKGACEQAQFESQQQRLKARQQLEQARRLVDISRERLRSLLGAYGEVTATGPEAAGPATAIDAATGSDLSRYTMNSPIAGAVESRHAAVTQRVAAETLLFELANTSHLWVNAELRERDWQGLSLRSGAQVKVRVPALPNLRLSAQVDHLGNRVSEVTHAVSLVARMAKEDSRLKPGMFAWIDIPAGTEQECLAIPPSALLLQDRRQFVFVETGRNRYERVYVTTGIETHDWTAVTLGLTAGQNVVAEGADILKAELLLEPEE